MLNKLLLSSAIIITTFYCCNIVAQVAISTTGGDAYSSAGSLSFTVGQTAYTYFQNENLDLGLGVQQAYAVQLLSASEEKNSSITRVFPNPTSDELIVLIDDKGLPVQVRVFSSLGELVFMGGFNGPTSRISFSDFSPGVYLVHISVMNENPRIFRIVKS